MSQLFNPRNMGLDGEIVTKDAWRAGAVLLFVDVLILVWIVSRLLAYIPTGADLLGVLKAPADRTFRIALEHTPKTPRLDTLEGREDADTVNPQ